jgi:TRAP-type C4-dicarboxylate transport system permease small subunit
MDLLRTICRFLSVATLFAIIVITLFQITIRWLFDIPLTGIEEFSRFLFVAFIFLGLPYYYRHDGHIKLSGIRNLLTSRNARLMEITIQFFCVLAFSIILASAVYTTSTNYDSTTPTIGIPFWIFFMPIILGFGLLVTEHIIDLTKIIKGRA